MVDVICVDVLDVHAELDEQVDVEVFDEHEKQAQTVNILVDEDDDERELIDTMCVVLVVDEGVEDDYIDMDDEVVVDEDRDDAM